MTSYIIETLAAWERLKAHPDIAETASTDVLVNTVTGDRYTTPAAAFQEF